MLASAMTTPCSSSTCHAGRKPGAMLTPYPPYAVTMHGLFPSFFVPFLLTMVTGTFVPSLLTAHSRTTSQSEKSTGEGWVRATLAVAPVAALKENHAGAST